MNYIFFALLATVLFSGSMILGKFISKHKIDNTDSLFTLMLLTITPSLLIVPLISNIQFTSEAVIPVLLYAATYLIGFYFFAKAIFLVDVSVIGPLFQIQGAFMVILAAIFLSERFSVTTYLWLATIIGGAMLVSVNENMSLKPFFQKGILLLLGMQLFHAISNIFVSLALDSIDHWSVLFFGGLTIAIIILGFIFIKKPKLKYSSKTIALLTARGAFSFFGAAALFKAFQENISISGVIGLLAAPIVFMISVLASTFYPKLLEHHSAKVYAIRGLGLLIILFGAIKLTLGQ